MKKALIIIGAAKYNRGSEILLTGIAKICKSAGIDEVIASSADINKNTNLNLPYIDRYSPRYGNIVNQRYIRFLYSVFQHGIMALSHQSPRVMAQITKLKCRHVLREIKNIDVVIFVGADNFDYSSHIEELNSLIDVSTKYPVKKILYDISITKEHITNHLVRNLNEVNFVTARDSISLANLMQASNKDDIELCSDGAFVVEPEIVLLAFEIPENCVGINLSNLIVHGKNSKLTDIVLTAYYNLIERITFELDMPVVLIPHVMDGADLSMLRILSEKYKDTGKVFLVDNEQLNARQLKYIISKCRFFVGARTHSTIAAYSSCVPTLVLGYSVKSLGIATDLFGTYQNYVIPVTTLETGDELVQGFNWIYEHESGIRHHLKDVMPEYKVKARKLADLIKMLIEVN